MKKIITVFLSLFLIMCLFVLPASAVGVADFFDTDIKIEILSDTFEIGRAVKFRIDFPENKPNTDTFIEIDEVAYLNLHSQVDTVADSNGIVDFGRSVDHTHTYYEGYFAPRKSGETQIVATLKIYAFVDNGEQISVPGDEWEYTLKSDTIVIPEIEVESGYFETPSEETFDVNEYYQNQYKQELDAQNSDNLDVPDSSEDDIPEDEGDKTGVIVFIVILAVLLVSAGVFFALRFLNSKKSKK